MTHSLAALLVPCLLACAADRSPTPARIYDFTGGPLVLAVPPVPPRPGASPKTILRYAIQRVQPALLGCYIAFGHGRTGTITLGLRLSVEPDATLVESVEVGGDVGDDELRTCMHDTASMIELAPMAEPGVIQIHYPLTVAP